MKSQPYSLVILHQLSMYIPAMHWSTTKPSSSHRFHWEGEATAENACQFHHELVSVLPQGCLLVNGAVVGVQDWCLTGTSGLCVTMLQ